MKSGQDVVEYILDSPKTAYSIVFQMLEYNDLNLKCARLDVRGCEDRGKA